MSIVFNETEKVFHLKNQLISYVFRVMENGQLEHLYYGQRLILGEGIGRFVERHCRPTTVVEFETDAMHSLDTIRQEFPLNGGGDFREAAIDVEFADGSHIIEWRYLSHQIQAGKDKIAGLPTTFAKEHEADTLVVTLRDDLSGLEINLSYSLFHELPVLTRSVQLVNTGEQPIKIKRLLSASLDLPEPDYEVLHLSGLWGRERHLYREPAVPGIKAVYSTRGASSHQHNPFIALAQPTATEDQGCVYSMNLIYSGNFLAQVDVDNFYENRLMIGIHPNHFEWQLLPGTTFETPEAILVFSNQGLNGMSQAYHQLFNHHLINPTWANQVRPILMNNWEGTYFDFTEEKILAIAKRAKEFGVELFVLDDGWFGKRNLDNSSLGDWFVNEEKLPSGISGLAAKINQLGLDFGLWFEPEMVNLDSHIMSEHPEWVVGTPNRFRKPARSQYVLDFSNPELVAYLAKLIIDILDSAQISYIKWDMNRNISEAYSAYLGRDNQGEFLHRYILGVYQLFDALLAAYPNLLIESCASGGGRFDPGMLYYAPQAWTSDNSDGIERLKIQYGTSMVYPISSMGAHVSAIPNHQVGRLTPLDTRANVAFFGIFGYEFDPESLSEEEISAIKEQVAYYKKHRDVLLFGQFTRLLSPFEGNETSWMVKSADLSQAIVGWYQRLSIPNDRYRRIKVPGLKAEGRYLVEETGLIYTGSELALIGIVLTPPLIGELPYDHGGDKPKRDFDSRVFTLQLQA